MFTARTWDFAHKPTWLKRCELWISVRSTCSQNSIEGKEKVPTEGANSTGQWAPTNGQRICSSRLSICSSGQCICFSPIWSSGPYMEYVLYAHMRRLAVWLLVAARDCVAFSLVVTLQSFTSGKTVCRGEICRESPLGNTSRVSISQGERSHWWIWPGGGPCGFAMCTYSNFIPRVQSFVRTLIHRNLVWTWKLIERISIGWMWKVAMPLSDEQKPISIPGLGFWVGIGSQAVSKWEIGTRVRRNCKPAIVESINTVEWVEYPHHWSKLRHLRPATTTPARSIFIHSTITRQLSETPFVDARPLVRHSGTLVSPGSALGYLSREISLFSWHKQAPED